jgi:MFS family permease
MTDAAPPVPAGQPGAERGPEPESTPERAAPERAAPERRGIGRFLPGLLHEQEFRRFWIGQTISNFGDQITWLALPVIAVLLLHADPAQMGLLTAFSLLPHLLFSLPAGVWLDRVQQRRRLMILMDLGRAAVIAAVPLAVFLNVLSIPLLFLGTFLVGTMSLLFMISWGTLFVAVARRDQYVEANALLNGSRSISSVGGPAIGGILIQILSAPIALVADALSFVGSAVFLSRIRATEAPIEHEPGSIRSQLVAGLSFTFRDPIVRPSVLAASTMNLFNYGFQGLFVLYVLSYLGVEPGILGLALGAGAIGSVVGAVVASRVGQRFGIGGAFLLGMILFPGATILIPIAAPDMPMVLIIALLFVAELVSGFGVMILDINAGAMLFARTPDRIRGRAMGAFGFINNGVRPIGAVVGGLIGSVFGVRETLFVMTILSVAGVLWLVGTPIVGLRDIPETSDPG